MRRSHSKAQDFNSFDPQRRIGGQDWLPSAHTMNGLKRLDSVQFCVEDVLKRGIPGDLMETGVWRGGACILMRGVLKADGLTDRTVWLADSFEGLPAPKAALYPHDRGSNHHHFGFLAT